jgi:hypothetical protein
MSEIEKQEQAFLKLLYEILDAAKQRNITMVILGALAFRIHCPKFKHMIYQASRSLTDLDFAGYMKDADRISALLAELGYQELLTVRTYFGGRRRMFENPKTGMKSDLFIDGLYMCHDINFKGRLNLDYPTLSLVDLLLEKMQMVELDAKDVIDTIALIREHEIGSNDKETINTEYLSSLCASDWGLWMTVTTNLNKVRTHLAQFDAATDEEKKDVERKITQILEIIDKTPKTTGWKMRAKIGTKKKWYRTISAAH